jgi:hypothetical protein
MDEAQHAEVEVIALYVESARERADRAVANLRAMGAEEHLIEAAEAARDQLYEVNHSLTQRTLFAVPTSQPTL